jgi:hypothetical protein
VQIVSAEYNVVGVSSYTISVIPVIVSADIGWLALRCRFLNKDLGFACGGSGSLFKTENGGKTWKREKVRTDSSTEHRHRDVPVTWSIARWNTGSLQ